MEKSIFTLFAVSKLSKLQSITKKHISPVFQPFSFSVYLRNRLSYKTSAYIFLHPFLKRIHCIICIPFIGCYCKKKQGPLLYLATLSRVKKMASHVHTPARIHSKVVRCCHISDVAIYAGALATKQLDTRQRYQI